MNDAVTSSLVAVLLIGGYFLATGTVCQDVQNRRIVPILAGAVLLLYLCAVGFLGLLFAFFENDRR